MLLSKPNTRLAVSHYSTRGIPLFDSRYPIIDRFFAAKPYETHTYGDFSSEGPLQPLTAPEQ